MASVYDSERLAACYAFDRPPIHEQILRSAHLDGQADQAPDVGCGAGLSTAATAADARDWCQETLRTIFADGEVTVLIPGYVATLARA